MKKKVLDILNRRREREKGFVVYYQKLYKSLSSPIEAYTLYREKKAICAELEDSIAEIEKL